MEPLLVTVADNATADTTSNPIDITGAKKVSIFLNEADESVPINNRQVDLTVQVSIDGTTFVGYNLLIQNLTNANNQDLTRVATINRATAGTDVLYMQDFTLKSMKVLLDVTDGASPKGYISCKVLVEF
jgi:hypothetical protein